VTVREPRKDRADDEGKGCFVEGSSSHSSCRWIVACCLAAARSGPSVLSLAGSDLEYRLRRVRACVETTGSTKSWRTIRRHCTLTSLLLPAGPAAAGAASRHSPGRGGGACVEQFSHCGIQYRDACTYISTYICMCICVPCALKWEGGLH